MKQKNKLILLREMQKSDAETISEAFKQQGWQKPVAQYSNYYQEQISGQRQVLIAEINDEFAGYLTIKWKSDYLPFLNKGIPEITDLNVLKKFQRLGIATALMNEAEDRIKNVSDEAGIGFGVTKDYGTAQKLYIKRNYQPDGRGLVFNSTPLKYGDVIKVTDDIVFHLIKKLS